MTNKTLTVVVPTYNMENYLEKCLSSLIVSEKYLGLLEVIVVNDGSTDRSSQIAHWFERVYPQTFKVFDKENGNYGSCINFAIGKTTGKYIKVLDADDYFSTSAFEDYLMLLGSTDADVVINDYQKVTQNGTITKTITFDIQSLTSLPIDEVIDSLLKLQMHAIAYKTAILRSSAYQQTEKVSYTDQEWILIPFIYSNSVYYSDKNIYNYLVGRDGQTMDNAVFKKSGRSLYIVVNELLKCCATYNNLTSARVQYIEEKLSQNLKNLYKVGIIYNGLPFDNLNSLDNYLKIHFPNLYAMLEDFHYSRIPFIKHWRKKKRLYLSDRLFLTALHFKQKALNKEANQLN